MTDYFAHSKNKVRKKHLLADHLTSVGNIVRCFSEGLAWQEEVVLAGLLHDAGKYGDLFQARLRGEAQGIDHWSLGAWLALEHKAVAAALAIQGHHIGLQNLSKDHLKSLNPKQLAINHPLQLRLSEGNLDVLKSRLTDDGLTPQINHTLLGNELKSTVSTMLDVRMIFSALTDADFLDTEAHFKDCVEGKRYRSSGPDLQREHALEILLEHIKELQAQTQAAPEVTDVRASLINNCLKAAESAAGLFTLTAPTGSGKTLAMLAFALKHAIERQLRRVVIVLPYLSIIEQTSAIYRGIFESHFGQNYVLEHHSLAGIGVEKTDSDSESKPGEQETAERQRRLLAENWDAPLIITTSVQMLESLFSNRPSACRKLHRLAQSVIFFDEVQTLPASLAVPTLAALSHLAYGYGSSVVFSTATQPAFEHLHETVKSHCTTGWQPQRIVSEPQTLFAKMKRTQVSWASPDKGTSWDELARHIKNQNYPQVLCIVNKKNHAKTLWENIGKDAFHLSTNLCPAHRRTVLDTVCNRLLNEEPVQLVATQCIEAGVDVDFPVVYRAYAPLEAIIQAAGRCNREGRRETLGKVYVFQPLIEGNENEFPDSSYGQAAQITKMLFRRHGADKMHIDDPDFIAAYYRELYDISKPEAMKKTKQLLEYVTAGSFPDIAKEYRLIKQDAINVLVPYQAHIEEFNKLNDEGNTIGLTSEWIRRARPFTVSIYRPKQDSPIWDSLIPVKVAGRKDREQNDWFIYIKKEDYHPVLGLIPSGSLNTWIG
ncbi:MAG: CRISPR-associated helicase Cas3' [Nitrospiraceae bacterium]|nr:MAG: CRISPR-associated helicase Cas3' [Nitrospiraceae bacterium]